AGSEPAAGAAAPASADSVASGAEQPVARVGDAVSVTSTLRGKVEFESGEEGREIEILGHLLRTATAETFRARLAGLDLSGFTALVTEGAVIETGELVDSAELLRQVGTVPGLAKVLDRLGLGDAPSPGEAAAGIEFVLEGLHLTRRLAKYLTDDGRTRYGAGRGDGGRSSGGLRG
ncbi:magnesium chelatase, partial [Micromonospora zhanjiangensis]